MTEKTMTVGSAILCDDLRTEITGKNIIIGVYDPIFSVESFPINHKFAIAFIVDVSAGGNHSFRFRVIDNSDGQVLNGRIQLDTEEGGKNVSLPAVFFNLEMKKSSTLDIEVSYPNDEENWNNVGVWKIVEELRQDPVSSSENVRPVNSVD
ncbi:hypothetical protein [Methylobacterium sp. Leaf89]|uniref:DUF6941 family protein n=1 Tax=Methylobacterium sp. Leaf89 TaxID=1736245 RepID=UPI000AB717A3|nr:hypothetical protein [Methylobacterium sp. Leaf89]